MAQEEPVDEKQLICKLMPADNHSHLFVKIFEMLYVVFGWCPVFGGVK